MFKYILSCLWPHWLMDVSYQALIYTVHVKHTSVPRFQSILTQRKKRLIFFLLILPSRHLDIHPIGSVCLFLCHHSDFLLSEQSCRVSSPNNQTWSQNKKVYLHFFSMCLTFKNAITSSVGRARRELHVTVIASTFQVYKIAFDNCWISASPSYNPEHRSWCLIKWIQTLKTRQPSTVGVLRGPPWPSTRNIK